jgi:aspartate racemase
MNEPYTLGVIGGMGPMATATFMEILIQKTTAACDQEHLPMVVRHIPQTPDRTAFILGQSEESPQPYILEAAKKLVADGVREIAIPCVTSHFFHDEIQKEINIPMLDGVEDTARALASHGVKKVGIMATSGTVTSRLFTKAFAGYEMDCIYPDDAHQDMVMSLIYDCVKSNKSVDASLVAEVLAYLQQQGAEVVVLGCTELSLIPKEYLKGETIDVMEVLAERCLEDWKHGN